MILGKTHYKLAVGFQSGREVLSFLPHILLNLLEKILPKMREKILHFSLALRKGRQTHAHDPSFNVSSCTSQLSPEGLLCTHRMTGL